MEIISNPTQDEIKKAAKALKDGHLVAFPTETVYGLGADATNEKAVSRIYSVKGRPTDHPLIVHISSINQLEKWAIDIPDYAVNLANEFWPGPMTLILKRSELAMDFITGGQDSVGLRVPGHPVALALLSEFEKYGGEGVTAPSANRFGAVSPTTALAAREELFQYLNKVHDVILDGGRSLIGLESTIINCTVSTPEILRPGAITKEMVENSIGIKTNKLYKSDIRVSGLLKIHYAPKAKIILDILPKPGEGFFAMAHIPTPKGAIRLAAPETVEAYASDLYAALRRADLQEIKIVNVMQPNGIGLAEAIRDRLTRASS